VTTPETAPSARAVASPVGELLRHWRATRRLSQLALALEASTTARHLSFVESGRSQPSREMVLRLARALDVPIRERNQLLLAAGYAPFYREAGLDGAQAAQVRAALGRMLAAHEPFPAVVMDRHWNVVTANSAADAFFGWLLSEREAGGPANVIRLMFAPEGLRPFVANWDAAAEALIQRIHREAVGGVPDPETLALLDEALAYPGVPSRWLCPDFRTPPLPIIPVEFEKNGLALSYFSTVTTLGTPQDAPRELLPRRRHHRRPHLASDRGTVAPASLPAHLARQARPIRDRHRPRPLFPMMGHVCCGASR
jgi:transcriptional regulator with XRE-family HTH domain